MQLTLNRVHSIYKKWGVLNILFILRRLLFLGSPILLASILPTTTYGLLVLIFACFNCINFILPLSLSSGFIRYYYESKDPQLFFRYIGSSLIIVMLVLAFIIVLFYSFFPAPLNTLYLVSLILLLSILQSASEFFFSYLRLSENYRLFNYLNSAMSIWIILGLALLFYIKKIYLIPILLPKILMLYLGYFTIPSLFFIIHLLPLLPFQKWLEFTKKNRALVSSVCFFSICLIPANLGYFINDAIDKLVINSFFSTKEVGIYGFIYQLSFFPAFLFSQVSKNTITPHVYKEYRKKNIAAYLKKNIYITLALFSLVQVILLSTSKYITMKINPEFLSGISNINTLLIASLSLILTPFFINNIHLSGKSYLSTIIELSSGLLNLFLNVMLVPKYGLTGATNATLISFFLRSALQIILGHKVYHIQLPILKITTIICLLYLLGRLYV